VSFSHVFETVDDDTVPESSSSKTESQIKTLEALLEDLKKRKSGSSSGASNG
jgi:hypothetical protein